MRYLLIILATCISFLATRAQNHENHEHDHHHYHIGLGMGGSWLSETSSIHPSLHLHLLKALGHSEKWQIGLGYESIFGEEVHHSFNIPIAYSPFNHFNIKAGPGISITSEDEHNESSLTAHLECIYEFEIGGIHLGPLIGYGIDKHGHHIGFGIHLGMGL